MPGFDSLARQIELFHVLVSPAGLPRHDHLRGGATSIEKATDDTFFFLSEAKHDKEIPGTLLIVPGTIVHRNYATHKKKPNYIFTYVFYY